MGKCDKARKPRPCPTVAPQLLNLTVPNLWSLKPLATYTAWEEQE